MSTDNFSWDNSANDDDYQGEYFDDYLESSSDYKKNNRQSANRSKNVRKNRKYRTKKIYFENTGREKYKRSSRVRERREQKTWKREKRVRSGSVTKYKAKKRSKTYRTGKKRPGYYRVRKGDCLISIAKKFGVSLARLRKVNSLRRSRIRIGQRIKIPSNGKKKADKTVLAKKAQRTYKNPGFIWPIKNIYKIKRDGQDGVKAIGVFIESRTGSKVRAAASGKIKKIGEMRGYGKYIVVQHKNRYISVYSNLKEINVSEGQSIRQGRVIGILQRDNKKLHFQINCAGKAKDPRRLVKNKS